MERPVSAQDLHRHRRGDPPDAGLAHPVCRREAGDWYRPDLWPDFRLHHVVLCFTVLPAMTYLAAFVPLYGVSLPDLVEAQRRIFADNTTTAIAGHTYMSAWPSWPLLARPVWFLFDKTVDDNVSAIVFLGNPWCCGRRCSRSPSCCAISSSRVAGMRS